MLALHPIADLPIADVPASILVRESSGIAPLTIPQAPEAYDRHNEQTARNEVRRLDLMSFKRGQDVRLQQGERLILKDTVTSTLYSVSIVSGVLTLTVIT